MDPRNRRRDRIGQGWVGAIALVATLLAAVVSSASPIQYEIHRSLGANVLPTGCGIPGSIDCFTYTLDGTVTTDGTVGFWTENHFLNISLVLSDGTNSVALTKSTFDFSSTIVGASDQYLGTGFPYNIQFRDALGTSSWSFCSIFRTTCWEGGVLASKGVTLTFVMPEQNVAGVGIPFATAVAPEPGTSLLLGLGLASLSAGARRRPGLHERAELGG